MRKIISHLNLPESGVAFCQWIVTTINPLQQSTEIGSDLYTHFSNRPSCHEQLDFEMKPHGSLFCSETWKNHPSFQLLQFPRTLAPIEIQPGPWRRATPDAAIEQNLTGQYSRISLGERLFDAAKRFRLGMCNLIVAQNSQWFGHLG
jgi:hypothetical protein